MFVGVRSVCALGPVAPGWRALRKRAVGLVADTVAHDDSLGFLLIFMPRRFGAPRAPRDSGEALRDPLANDGNYYYLQSQLSNGLAQGPDALPLMERCSERVEAHTRGSHQLYSRGVTSHHTLVGRAGLRPLEERLCLEPVLLPPSVFA